MSKSLSKKETDQIFASNKSRIRNSGLEVLLAPTHLDFGRIIVITPKAIGNAPKRNQVRRRLKAIFYEDQLYTLKYDCAVIVRKAALNLEYEALKKILVSILTYKHSISPVNPT
ncbi:MAG: ribonuclease P protein component [Candidatus Babeliales bacterium]|nr:ribonuclease P protein component [Candidatus Babeliales bacterium]